MSNKQAPVGSVTADMKAVWQNDVNHGLTYQEIANKSINQKTFKPYKIQTIQNHTTPSKTKLSKLLPSILDIPSREYAFAVNKKDKAVYFYTPITSTKAIPSNYYKKKYKKEEMVNWAQIGSNERRAILGWTSVFLCAKWFYKPADILPEFKNQIEEAAMWAGNTVAQCAGMEDLSYQAAIACILITIHIVSSYSVFETINKIPDKMHNGEYYSFEDSCGSYGQVLFKKLLNSPGLRMMEKLRDEKWQETPYAIVAYLAYFQSLINAEKEEPFDISQVPLERADMNPAKRFAATCVKGKLNPRKLTMETLFGAFCANIVLEEGLAKMVNIHPSQDNDLLFLLSPRQ